MEAPIEDMKQFLDGILHIYDEGRTAVKISDLFGMVAEADETIGGCGTIYFMHTIRHSSDCQG